jgi:hypothetical protein
VQREPHATSHKQQRGGDRQQTAREIWSGVEPSRFAAECVFDFRSNSIGTAEFKVGGAERIVQGPVVISGPRASGAALDVLLDLHGLRKIELPVDIAIQPGSRFITVHCWAPH